jgi:hypothetical protein
VSSFDSTLLPLFAAFELVMWPFDDDAEEKGKAKGKGKVSSTVPP